LIRKRIPEGHLDLSRISQETFLKKEKWQNKKKGAINLYQKIYFTFSPYLYQVKD